MRLVIYGSRTAFPTDVHITNLLASPEFAWAVPADVREIVCGMAGGADAAGKRWAEANKIPVAPFPADWSKNGKGAGYVRNREMAEYATHGLGFWRGESRGTAHMTALLVLLQRPVKLVEWKP